LPASNFQFTEQIEWPRIGKVDGRLSIRRNTLAGKFIHSNLQLTLPKREVREFVGQEPGSVVPSHHYRQPTGKNSFAVTGYGFC
jgi:hypothetical protein